MPSAHEVPHISWATLTQKAHAARQDLPEISGIIPPLVEDGLAALARKEATPAKPSFTYIFPYLLSGFEQLNSRRELYAAWIAINCYIALCDEAIDERGGIGARSLLSASALLGWGLSILGKHAANTPFFEPFIHSINSAFEGEYLDHKLRDGSEARDYADRLKNRAVIAFSASYLAAANRSASNLLDALDELLPPFQTLDDLADVEQDYYEKNITKFVSIITSKNASSILIRPSRRELYGALLRDSRVDAQIQNIINVIQAALLNLDILEHGNLIAYLGYLHTEMHGLQIDIQRYRGSEVPIEHPLRRIDGIICGT